jgi:hypothetical protein
MHHVKVCGLKINPMTKKEALEVLMQELSKNNEHMFRLKLMAIYLQEYEVAAKIKAIDINKLKGDINEALNKE